MPQSTTMTIRLEPELKDRLDKLAESTHRSKSYLATEAIREFVELNEWQVKEIELAIKEADAEEFSSDAQVKKAFNKWGVNGD